MNGINKVILIGTLGRDPEVRYQQSGDAVCNLSIATNEKWKDKSSGEQHEKTEWHRVVLFRRLAEVAGEYLKKGSRVYVEGKIQTRKWNDSDGNVRYTTEIVGAQMQMLDGRKSSGDDGQASAPAGGGGHEFEDDIPFFRAVDGSLW